MTYRVILSRQAKRYYANSPQPTATRLARAFIALETDPRPKGATALKGELARLWRIRLGSLRPIYEIDDDRVRILVIRIGSRGSIYGKG